MAELIQVAEHTYYIDLFSKVGLYIPEPGEAILIDSSNAESAKVISSILDEHNLKLRCILNTHSHSDHIGSNSVLQERYNCPIYASALEAASRGKTTKRQARRHRQNKRYILSWTCRLLLVDFFSIAQTCVRKNGQLRLNAPKRDTFGNLPKNRCTPSRIPG